MVEKNNELSWSAIWDYRNEPVIAVLSSTLVVLAVFILILGVWQFFVRGAPFKCYDVWFPSSAAMCGSEELVQRTFADLPIGAIVPYFGTDEGLPSNWLVCDGRNVPDDSPITMDANQRLGGDQLPDLRNKFVRGAYAELNNQSIASGGSDTIDLSHSHVWVERRGDAWWSYDNNGQYSRVDNWSNGIHNDGEETYPFMVAAGVKLYTDPQTDANADNRPDFVELRYIIRVR